MSSFKEFYETNEDSFSKVKNFDYSLLERKKQKEEVPKNESFKDFYNVVEDEQLDEEMLNEDPTTIVLAVLGLPSVVALLAWVGSILFTTYFRGIGRITSKVI